MRHAQTWPGTSSASSAPRTALRTSPGGAASRRRFALAGFASALLAAAVLAGTASAQYVQVADGRIHALALKADGTVRGWYAQYDWQVGNPSFGGELLVPALPPGLTYVEVAAGGTVWGFEGQSTIISLARRSDGSVVVLGGLPNAPALPPGTNYVQIAAGNAHALALRSDGSIAAWGNNASGQCNVPALPPGLTYVEVAAGGWHELVSFCSWPFPPPPQLNQYGFSVARRSDGSVVAWGNNTYGQLGVPALAPGLSFVEISAGGAHVAARLSDGSVVAWGSNWNGQRDVTPPPAGLSYVEVDAGGAHTIARLSDGTLVTTGQDVAGVLSAPALPPGLTYIEVAAGGGLARYRTVDGGNCETPLPPPSTGGFSHFVAIRSDGSLVGWGREWPVEMYTERYCTSTANSTGCAATLTASGSPSLGTNYFALSASCVPDGPCLFFHGSTQQQAPFGDGFRCTGGAVVRIAPMSPASGGWVETLVDLGASQITSAGTRNFQCIFRDPQAGLGHFNTSNALAVTFVP